MKTSSVVVCISLASSLAFARPARFRDETAKIEVGPSETSLVQADGDPAAGASAEADPTDAVGKPFHKPVVITTDAPHGPDAEATADNVASSTSQTATASTDVDAPAEEPTSTHAPASTGEPISVAPIDSAKTPPVKAHVGGTPIREEKAASKLYPGDAGEAETAPAAKSADVEPVVSPAVEPMKDAPTKTAAPAKEHAPLETKHQAVDGVTAEQSLKWLENGNTRFVTKKFRADGKTESDRARIAKDQKPHAIVLSCSDSRVPPELIFDQALGEITTIRVAGEVPDASVIASIEQTILKQHPHLLVVLGHTQCESIEATLAWKENPSAGSEPLDRLVAEIKPHLKTVAQSSRSAGLATEAALQADGVARELSERSEIIKKAVDSGDLTIRSGLYWLDTGKVKFY